MLIPVLSRKAEVIQGCLEPGSGNVAMPLVRAQTENFIYVLSGKLLVVVRGQNYILEAEDTICFNGPDLTQISIASDSEEVEWIAMITPPVF